MLKKIVDGRTDLVFDFVAAGNDASSRDESGVSLLQWCAYYGDVSAMKFLLSRSAELDSLGDNRGLNNAAFHGHWRLCQFLLESGADPNFQLTDTEESPLHLATSKANRPTYNHVIRVLLAYKANPNCKTKNMVTTGAFMRDCRTKGETPLHRAAAFCDEQAIKWLIDAGADIEAKDANGDTPLTWASWHLRPGPILKLLCYGDHSINPTLIRLMQSDHGNGWGGMDAHLLGKPHLET